MKWLVLFGIIVFLLCLVPQEAEGLNANVTFNVTPVSYFGTGTNITLYHNSTGTFAANKTVPITNNNTLINITEVFEEGSYLWGAQLCDDGMCNLSSTNLTFSVSVVNVNMSFNFTPNFYFGSGTNCSLLTNKTGTFSRDVTNTTPVNATLNTIYLQLLKGTWLWGIECCDDGMCNSSDNYTLTVQAIIPGTVPNVTLSFPLNASTLTANLPIAFNYTVVDAENDTTSCDLWGNFSGSWALNQSNTTATGFDNVTIQDEGDYKWNVECNSTGPKNAFAPANYTFTILSTVPTVTLWSPPNASNFTTEDLVSFISSATDNGTITQCDLYHNSTGTFVLNQTELTPGNNTNISWTPILFGRLGRVIWNVQCNNTFGTPAWSANNYTMNFINLSGCVLSDLEPTLLEYQANMSLVNWTAIFESNATKYHGNYTWNFTELNISALNITQFVFNVTNNCTEGNSIRLRLNQTQPWYNWYCMVNGTNINVTGVNTNLTTLKQNQTQFMNCTLDLLNTSQQVVNWTVTVDRTNYNFNWSWSLGP